MKTYLLGLTPKDFCHLTWACDAGRHFAARYTTMAEVWDKCERVDWLVWILWSLKHPEEAVAREIQDRFLVDRHTEQPLFVSELRSRIPNPFPKP